MGRPRTRPTSTVTVAPYAVVLAAVAGAWLAHGLEYVRVWGWGGFGSSAARQIHTYMGPIGLVLLALAFVGVEVGLRSFRRLERLLLGLSEGTVDLRDASPVSRRFELPITSLLALLWVLQLVLYVVQENVELRAIGVHQPALGVLTGPHQLVAAVHLLVAAALAGALWLLHRPIIRLAEVVRQVVAWLAATRRRKLIPVLSKRAVLSWTPAERWGTQRWCRPPPQSAAA